MWIYFDLYFVKIKLYFETYVKKIKVKLEKMKLK